MEKATLVGSIAAASVAISATVEGVEISADGAALVHQISSDNYSGITFASVLLDGCRERQIAANSAT
jgi:hypothetical protein